MHSKPVRAELGRDYYVTVAALGGQVISLGAVRGAINLDDPTRASDNEKECGRGV